MSKYTTELRFICENYAGYDESVGYDKIDDVIENSRDKVFDFDFPMFDENYRSVLETKIIRHYYTREIGVETVALWKHFLYMRMNEIMPYYNKLYNSELLDFNPLYNVKYDTTHKGNASGTSRDVDDGNINENVNETRNTNRNEDGTYKDNSMDKYSDTPQGTVQNLIDGTYLTNAREIKRDGEAHNVIGETENINRDRDVETSNTRNSEFKNTDDYLRHVEGNNGSRTFSELLLEYRQTFINIDMMIINELNDLFMGVW